MANLENFDRQYRFAAGPAGGAGFEVGAPSGEHGAAIHCNFSFQKSDLETQNTGKVSLWNLSPAQLAVLNRTDCVASFRAGYGKRIALIFAGVVSFVSTTLDNADTKTEIEIVDNLVNIRDTYVSVTYDGVVSWKKIMDDVAAQMGVVVNYSYNATFANVTNGYSYVGKAKDIMSKGCACCGLTWSLQNGVMQVKKPGGTMNQEVYLLSAQTGMVGSPARVVITSSEEGKENEIGWDVEYFMNGAINIDDFVRVESRQISGYFRVYSLDINGDNESGDWLCKARLLEVKP